MPLTEQEIFQKMMQKYKDKLEVSLNTSEDIPSKILNTREYSEFKKEYISKKYSFYEKACKFSEKFLKIKPDKKRESDLNEAVKICHLNITPTGAVSFAILAPILYIISGIFLSFVIPLLSNGQPNTFFILFFLFSGIILYFPLNNLPFFLANKWRMQASNQMIICIFYVVTHMRHSSNLENALKFASDNISPPLSLDIKKVLWDVETQKYKSVVDSLEAYLNGWKKYSLEFVEAFHLIEGSLLESSEEKRLESLDKALDVILEETYEKMMHFAHNLQSPITMLNMLGVVLPVLGLVILPLIVSFMPIIKWYHISLIYNIILPILVYYLGKNILSTRPTGYGSEDISTHPGFDKYKKFIFGVGKSKIRITPLFFTVFVGILFVFIGVSPLILHEIHPEKDYDFCWSTREGFLTQEQLSNLDPEKDRGLCFLDYKYETISGPGGTITTTDKLIGPFGIGAALLSIFIPFGIALAIGIYFKIKTKHLIEIKNKSQKLETEFASALFQLGNRLGDGIPAEIAFQDVADMTEGTTSGNFFQAISTNIRRLGFSVKQAIFDRKIGAIQYFPSSIVESSMAVLIESVKKGPLVASRALINISRYIKEIHKVNERLKDLLADVISSMKSQIKFLTPVIAGIVVGITSMITTILMKIGEKTTQIGNQNALGSMFRTGIPSFYFQIIVGLYVVQIVYILSVIANGIENGSDKLREEDSAGHNVSRSVIVYSFIALVIIFLFNFIASNILAKTIAG